MYVCAVQPMHAFQDKGKGKGMSCEMGGGGRQERQTMLETESGKRAQPHTKHQERTRIKTNPSSPQTRVLYCQRRKKKREFVPPRITFSSVVAHFPGWSCGRNSERAPLANTPSKTEHALTP